MHLRSIHAVVRSVSFATGPRSDESGRAETVTNEATVLCCWVGEGLQTKSAWADAARSGSIAAIQDGDIIEIDLARRIFALQLTDTEIADRRTRGGRRHYGSRQV